MKRYMAILGFVFVGVLAGLLVRGIPIVLHVNAGGGVPQADQNGDVNGDQSLDISDAVFILRYLFSGGPEPVALAQGAVPDLGALEGPLSTLAGSLHDISKESLRESCRRFIDNHDGTLTDRYCPLMWRKDVIRYEEFEQNLNPFAGYNDWRHPTAMEYMSILRNPTMFQGNEITILPVFSGLVTPEDIHIQTEEGLIIEAIWNQNQLSGVLNNGRELNWLRVVTSQLVVRDSSLGN